MLPVRPYSSTGGGQDPLFCRPGSGPQRRALGRPLGCWWSRWAHRKDLLLEESTALPRAQVCQDLCSCRRRTEQGTVAEGSPTPRLHPTLVIWRWGRSRIPGRGWTAVPQLALSPISVMLG